VKKEIEELDTRKALVSVASDKDPLHELLRLHKQGGGLKKASTPPTTQKGPAHKANLRLRTFLLERLNLFKAAVAEIQAEVSGREGGASLHTDIFKLRQRIMEMERDVARRDPTLHGDFEFGEVDGALFGYPSYVPCRRDNLLMRDVFYLCGACSFKCFGSLVLPEGCWRVGFAVKCDKSLNFDGDVLVTLNGEVTRRLRLEEELKDTSSWVMIEVGEVVGGDNVEVDLAMYDHDFDSPAQPRPKYGLYVDRVVGRRTTPGLEGAIGGGGPPPLFVDSVSRQVGDPLELSHPSRAASKESRSPSKASRSQSKGRTSPPGSAGRAR